MSAITTGAELWDSRRTAAHLGVHRGTLYRWQAEGHGPPSVRVGGVVRYRPQDVDAWINEHTEDRTVSA